MGKLKDDEIRWILDIEATGVQAKIQNISSSSIKLADDNKRMRLEMKEAEDQMKGCLKEMKLLEKQGKETSDTYAQYENTLESARNEVAEYKSKIEQNTKAIADNDKQVNQIIKTMSIEEMTMTQLKNRAKELQSQMDNTSQSLSPEAYKKLEKELNSVNNRMGTVKNANKNLLQQFAGMNHPVGTAAKGIQGFGQALKALAMNPVGAIIMVLVGAFIALHKIINSNEESIHSLNRILAPMKAAFDGILNVLQGLVVSFLNFIESVLSGISKLLEKIPFLKKHLGEINTKAQEAIELERDKQNLQKRQRETLVADAKTELEIAKLRNDVKRKDLFTNEERLKKLDLAIKLEEDITKEKVLQAKESLRLLELEASRTKNLGEIEDKLAQARANVYNAEKEQYDKTRRMESERSAAILEMRREANEAAKKAMEDKLKEIDKNLNYEINLLKKKRMEGEVTEKEYNDKVEEMTIESLNKKMNIKGQEKYQLIQYESQILDAQIKKREEADRILLESLNKEKDKQLQMLDVAKNAKLEKLQEEETDQKIYALRAAEIEANAAEARQAVISQFGKTLAEAEFNNAKTQVDAIEENGKDIIAADTATLKEREKLKKLFLKTTADFERQFNVKTWEQRKQDELDILKKQHDTLDSSGQRLLSDEAYEIAKTLIEKKYSDERQKIREQYQLVSMSEMYNKELATLEENHRLGLLSEEEYEKAKLNLKLNYAQQYAEKASQFIKAASDAVSAIMSVETTSLENEYATRIQAAEGNAEEIERLEQEKAQKKLDIEKKYADVQFAIKASEILSSTAVAIMQAYAQLGPVAGAIAAGFVGVTGAAQLIVANKERQRVKSMTLSGAGSGKKNGERVVDGFAEGGFNDEELSGYTGDGDRYAVAGTFENGKNFHRGEYIIAQPEMKDPTLVPHIRAIERVRKKRTDKNPLPDGFAEGGYNGNDPAFSSYTPNNLSSLLEEIREFLKFLKENGVSAFLNFSEFEKKMELINQARKSASKKD